MNWQTNSSNFDTKGINTVGVSNTGRPFLGKESVNLAKKKDYKDDSVEILYEFLPTYNSQGRVQ